MGISDHMQAIISNLLSLGLALVVSATVKARDTTTSNRSVASATPGEDQGTEFSAVLLPLGDVVEVISEEHVRRITHDAFCPPGTSAAPNQYFVVTDGDTFEIVIVNDNADSHVQLRLEKVV